MPIITKIDALEILDSRGTPTIQVFLKTNSDLAVTASVPSGASTGINEAIELRDKESRYSGKGVLSALKNIMGPLKELLIGKSVEEQKNLDEAMLRLDGTENKSKLGANAILALSLAIAKAAALHKKIELYEYIAMLSGNKSPVILPVPMINILNGGAHADNNIEFQEFMIRPIGAPSFSEGLRWSVETFKCLKDILMKRNLTTSVGDEGGFAPNLNSNEEAVSIILEAIQKAGYIPEKEVTLALDCAASEFYDPSEKKYLKKKQLQKPISWSSEEQIDALQKLTSDYPIDSIEDGLDENDWKGWELLTQKLKNIQIVGDDIFVTNSKFLKKGIDLKVANAVLIKPNQIGTLTETLETIQLAQSSGYKTIISHRSGETEDTFIADLAVGTSSGQIKTGSVCRTDRVAKYNRLLRIEQLLDSRATYS